MTLYLAAATLALFVAIAPASAQTPPVKTEKTQKAEKTEKVEKMDHKADHKMDHKADHKMDHKADKMDHAQQDHSMQDKHHGMSPWKELDAFHMLVMETWHPAKDKSDMKATRAKSAELLASAKVLAASSAPKGCDSPKVKDAVKGLPAEAQTVADLVTKKADDAALKAALKSLHDKFEVAEGGCVMQKEGKK